MRIVHISDLHVGCFPRSPLVLFDKRLLGTLNWLVRRAGHYHGDYVERALSHIERLAPELVLCTGDIATVGSPQEHAAARLLLEPLRAAYGNRFVYVPGNHDHYVHDRRCKAALADAFATLNSGRWQLTDLPLEMTVSGVRFFLLGTACPVGWLRSSGCLPPAAEAWLQERLAAPRQPGETRVLVNHFPLRQADGSPLPGRRRLDRADVLWQHILEGRIDLALCGHIHRPFARWEADGNGEVCAGSLTLNGTFNVVDWLPRTGRFKQFFVDVGGADPGGLPVHAGYAPVG